MSEPAYLLDVNVLVALLSRDHVHHWLVRAWFEQLRGEWHTCPFTEAGFVRIATAGHISDVGIRDATEALQSFCRLPDHHFLPINAGWQELSFPFLQRIQGPKQVTDAYLLGLAVLNNLVLATLDSGLLHLAGANYRQHVMLLGS